MTGPGGTASSCTRGGSGWKRGDISVRKSGQALGRVAQGGGGVTVPGGAQGEVGRGAWGHGLVVTLVGGGGWTR